jgi:hypothetical protein
MALSRTWPNLRGGFMALDLRASGASIGLVRQSALPFEARDPSRIVCKALEGSLVALAVGLSFDAVRYWQIPYRPGRPHVDNCKVLPIGSIVLSLRRTERRIPSSGHRSEGPARYLSH